MGREGLERDFFLIRLRKTADLGPPFCCLQEPDAWPLDQVAPRRPAECVRTPPPFVPRPHQSPGKCATEEGLRPPVGGRIRSLIRSSPGRSTQSDRNHVPKPRLLDISAGLDRDPDPGILGGRRGLRGKARVCRETSRSWGRTRQSRRIRPFKG